MKRLRIALVIDDIYPASSGVGRSVQTQLEELTALGHQVTLLAPATGLEPPQGITTIALPSRRLPGLPRHTSIVRCSRHFARQLARQHQFDIIHSQTDTGALLLSARLARQLGIPHVHTFHTNMAGAHRTQPILTCLSSLGYRLVAYMLASAHRTRPQRAGRITLPGESAIARFDWRSQAIVAQAVTAVTTPSHYMLRYIRTAAGPVSITGTTIPTGYNRTFQRILQRTHRRRSGTGLRFVSISRLVKEKRLGRVISAFTKANIPGSELVIIGDGQERSRLETKAKLKLKSLRGTHKPSITFTGQVQRLEDIAQALRDADAFVLASYRFDNQPIVIPESLAAGLPVLYCDDRLDVGLSPSNSLLVGPSIKQLAAGMQQLADESTRHTLAAGAQHALADLSPEATATAYCQLYRQVLQQHTTPRKPQ